MLRQTVTIQLTCCVCGKVDNINTNRLEIYTDEVRKSHRCFRHKLPKPVKEKEEKMAETTAVVISDAQLEEISSKLRVPKGWKKEVAKRYAAGAKTLSMLLTELDSIVEAKTRIKGGDATLLAKMKEKIKASVRKTLAGVLKVEVA